LKRGQSGYSRVESIKYIDLIELMGEGIRATNQINELDEIRHTS